MISDVGLISGIGFAARASALTLAPREHPEGRVMIITKEKFDALRRIGSQMANVCCNLSQLPDRQLNSDDREIMAELVRRWDSASHAIVRTPKVRSR